METIVKFILLILLPLPFLALALDTLNMTKGVMIKVVCIVTTISALIAFNMGSLGQRPNVAAIYDYACITWPALLLVAKGFNPQLKWGALWLSVLLMSWYTVNMSMWFYYPVRGGGGGMGASVGLMLGWFYMVIPFAALSSLFVGGRAILCRIKGRGVRPA